MQRIDVRYMHRQGVLRTGMAGSLHWSCNGQQVASINYETQADAVRLKYRSRIPGSDWIDHDYLVYLEYTTCNYGGRRPWFLCPRCGRRVAILYGGAVYACRKCHQLAYKSQRETPGERAINRANKIRERLKWTPGIVNGREWKPKWMHWSTFDRLAHQHDMACNFGCAEIMNRLHTNNERRQKLMERMKHKQGATKQKNP